MFDDALRERPPYVRFERRAVEKRQLAPPAGDGSVYYVDVDFAIITPQGTKNTVERPVLEWFEYLKQMILQGRYNPEWLKAFQAGYEAWKAGEEMPLNGTALKNWPAITVSELKRLSGMHVLTIEDLAVLPEEGLEKLGMGGRSLKKRAQDWVQATKDMAPLVTELDALRVAGEGQKAEIESLRKQVERLVAMNEALQVDKTNGSVALRPLEERLADAQAALPQDPNDILNRL